MLLAAATAAEDEARLLSEGIRRSTPLEARSTSIAGELRTDDDAVTKMMPQTEEEALVVDTAAEVAELVATATASMTHRAVQRTAHWNAVMDILRIS